jgi:hypothetical protein
MSLKSIGKGTLDYGGLRLDYGDMDYGGITVTVHLIPWDYGDSALNSWDYGDSALNSCPARPLDFSPLSVLT